MVRNLVSEGTVRTYLWNRDHWLIILEDAKRQAAFLAFLMNNNIQLFWWPLQIHEHCKLMPCTVQCPGVVVRLSVLLPIATHTNEDMMDG